MEPYSHDTFAGIVTALAALISAAAWPALVGGVLFFAARNIDRVTVAFNRLLEGRGSTEVSTGTFGVEFVEKAATASSGAVIEAARKSPAGLPGPSKVSDLAESARAAAASLAGTMFDPGRRLRILWVDDHPEHNVDLQLAFQVLGMIVVCIDSNEVLDQSFESAESFDLVITDMNRDEVVERRAADPEGGLRTVSIVAEISPNTPVIVYAGWWATQHLRDPVKAPVILITNYPPDVFEAAVKLAARKAA